MTARAAISQIHDTLTAMAARPGMYGTTSEAVLFTALALLDVRAALLDGDECRASYEAAKAARGIPCAHHALLPMDQIGAFIADVYARERQRLPDAPTAEERLLSLGVDFRDEQAAAEVTVEQAVAYLQAHGWTEATLPADSKWRVFKSAEDDLLVARHRQWVDYGRRMCEAINALAGLESRSPLAVWREMRQGDVR